MKDLCHGGAIHFRVCNPDKFGIKWYQLCDDSGYCCQYELYTEKRGGSSEYGATYDLCMWLMTETRTEAIIYMWIIVIHLQFCFLIFISRVTGACGTLRVNMRHVPDSIKKGNPAKGNHIVVSNGPLMIVVSWQAPINFVFHHTQGRYGGYWKDQRYTRDHTEARCCPELHQAHRQCGHKWPACTVFGHVKDFVMVQGGPISRWIYILCRNASYNRW